MDIRTLPGPERDIYNRLKQKYSLHFESLKIKEYSLRILKPSDLDELLDGQAPLENVGSFPFWFRLWESSIVLAHTLVSDPKQQNGLLLELSAGLGLAGLAAAKAGFAVTLADNEQVILDFQSVSGAANGLPTVKNILVDLLDPPPLETFDVIAGAEILFKEDFIEPMLNLCQNYLKPDGTVYLAHDLRRRCLPLFLERAEQYFVIGTRKQTVTRGGRTTDILVNRLQRRG